MEDSVDYANVVAHHIAEAMEWIELQDEDINLQDMQIKFGTKLEEVNRTIFGYMKRKLKGAARIWLKSQRAGEGIQAWRKMITKYDPMNGETELDMHNKIMYRPRCAHFKDVPGAIEQWEAEQLRYTTKSGKELDRDHLMNAMLRMLPDKMEKSFRFHMKMMRRTLEYSVCRK